MFEIVVGDIDENTGIAVIDIYFSKIPVSDIIGNENTGIFDISAKIFLKKKIIKQIIVDILKIFY